ncbi:unnamed protein product, partial [Ixodes hexagonus]
VVVSLSEANLKCRPLVPTPLAQVSYPRSGTHWVQQIIQLILYEKKSAETFSEFSNRAPFIEIVDIKNMAVGSPRLLRTHIPFGRVPFSNKAKYVYVARNPWDCCVSVYHYLRSAPGFDFENGTFDDCLIAFLDGTAGFGDYFSHVISGYNRRNEPNVFFVTYEELFKDRQGVILRLAHFLGGHHGKRLECDCAALEDILEKTSTAFMKRMLKTNAGELLSLLLKNPRGIQPSWLASYKDKPASTVLDIVRHGRPGDCRHYFTPENVEKMEAKINERATCTDLLKLWKRD